MAQPIAKKLLVVGGSGFLGIKLLIATMAKLLKHFFSVGLNICKLAANKGWETISLR